MAFDPLFSGFWYFGDNPIIEEPLPQNWRWNSPDYTLLAFNVIDANLTDRGLELGTLEAGDRINLRSISNAGNYAMFDVTAVTSHATWFELGVTVFGTGPVPGLPVSRQRCLLDFLRPVAAVVGPIAGRYTELVELVAAGLHRPVDDPQVAEAVNAAIIHVVYETGRDDVGLPADPETFTGLVLFSKELYLRPPNGVLGAIGDNTFQPMFTPNDIYQKVHGWFDKLNTAAGTSWGVA